MRIGLFPGSFKPYHAGHHAAVLRAAAECDAVRVIASQSDRIRKGQYPIMMKDMEKVWQLLMRLMPDNVTVEFASVPIRHAYEIVAGIESAAPETTHVSVYADPEDMQDNFPMKSRLKYMPGMMAAGRIQFVELARTTTVNISGTRMRECLASGDRVTFEAGLPDGVDGNAVWNALRTFRGPQPIVMA